MPKKKYGEEDTSPSGDEITNQEQLSEDDLSSIRTSLDAETETTTGNKKFVTGLRPNPPPRLSWWDKAKDKFTSGATLVPKNWSGDPRQICKVCCPGKLLNSYWVKFYETRNETEIDGSKYIVAPHEVVFVPYMDEYTKWRLSQKKT